MTAAEYEVYVRRFMAGLEVRGGTYRPRDFGEIESVECLAVITEMRDLGAYLGILHSQLVLNAVITVDAFTISDAEPGVQPEMLANVFRLAVEARVWVGE